MKDGPKIAMRVERGHLVPASQFDAELLGNWYEGAIVSVMPVRAIQRPLERKYFAMVGRLLAAVETPWTSVETAHEAIKLATGFIEPIKLSNGGWGKRSRSITQFTDQELQDFFELFCGIVSRRFGIDPDRLHIESSGSSVADAPRAQTDDRPGAGSPHGAGAPTTLAEDQWLKQTARMLVAATAPDGDTDILDRQKNMIRQHHTPVTISDEALKLAGKIYNHCRRVCLRQEPLSLKLVATLAGCRIVDLKPESR